MKRGSKHMDKRWPSVGTILLKASGLLLVLTVVSVCLIAGLYARYTTGYNAAASARVAVGLPNVEVKEHKAELVSGVYVLKNDKTASDYEEVTSNTYDTVIPGTDIAKDPFLRLTGASEVDYWLYVQVTEKAFPTRTVTDGNGTQTVKTVTYELDPVFKAAPWTLDDDLSDEDNGVYVYKRYVDAGTAFEEPIYILKDNILTVSEHYVGTQVTFSLTFSAWAEQVD